MEEKKCFSDVEIDIFLEQTHGRKATTFYRMTNYYNCLDAEFDRGNEKFLNDYDDIIDIKIILILSYIDHVNNKNLENIDTRETNIINMLFKEFKEVYTQDDILYCEKNPLEKMIDIYFKMAHDYISEAVKHIGESTTDIHSAVITKTPVKASPKIKRSFVERLFSERNSKKECKGLL